MSKTTHRNHLTVNVSNVSDDTINWLVNIIKAEKPDGVSIHDPRNTQNGLHYLLDIDHESAPVKLAYFPATNNDISVPPERSTWDWFDIEHDFNGFREL